MACIYNTCDDGVWKIGSAVQCKCMAWFMYTSPHVPKPTLSFSLSLSLSLMLEATKETKKNETEKKNVYVKKVWTSQVNCLLAKDFCWFFFLFTFRIATCRAWLGHALSFSLYTEKRILCVCVCVLKRFYLNCPSLSSINNNNNMLSFIDHHKTNKLNWKLSTVVIMVLYWNLL